MTEQIPYTNLSETEAAARLIRFGRNELPQAKQENFWVRGLKLFKEPMLLLLIAAGAIYLIMGDLGEGLMLGASIFVVLGISLYQDYKSEKALAALKELSSPRALVIRGGSEKRIPSGLLVPGDLVALYEGDRVPADGVILQCSHLNIDESLLTGESFPAKKLAAPEADTGRETAATLDNAHRVFSSTLVIRGTAFFRVLSTGAHTEVGKIGKSLQEVEPEELNLGKEIRQLVRLFLWLGSVICISIVILYGLSRGQWLQAFLVGLATQMSLLPEEFPVVLAIFLAMGAWRLSKIQVLIRRPASIERLGAVTVLCVDKTGTLTQNQMTVAGLNNTRTSIHVNDSNAKNLAEEFHSVIEFGVLASHRDPFDPMEKAIRRLIQEEKWGQDHLHQDWDLIRDYPLSDKLMAMSCVWKEPHSEAYVIAAKGAPEAIVELCHLSEAAAQNVLAATQSMANEGLRVLGVARAAFSKKPLPNDQHDFDFQWMGLIGLEDPLRPEVPKAIQICRQAGIRVIMMTGDYAETARKIAAQAGIDTVDALLTGAEVKSLSDQDLSDRLRSAHIFARMIPEQKLRIVELLKGLGHVVGMTGDGVNDAPSLKRADIGISMGARGTDVAREASDIVLLDDNFASIVSGIERGRLIFSNIKKAMRYIVSIHVPIAGLSIFPVLFNWPLMLFPIHIVFLELIIDPACSLMFESQTADKDAMARPPRSLKSRLFSFRDLMRSMLQGAFILSLITAVAWYGLSIAHEDPDRIRSFSFTLLVMSNIGLIFADLSEGSWRQLVGLFRRISNWIILLAVISILFLSNQVTNIRTVFHFGKLRPTEFLVSLAIAFFIFVFISLWNGMAKKIDTSAK